MLSGFIMSCDDGRRANSTRLDVAVSDGVTNDAALSDTIMDAGVPAMRDHVFLLRVLDFAREEDSQSLGFDLDDSVTEQGGISGCGHADFQTPVMDRQSVFTAPSSHRAIWLDGHRSLWSDRHQIGQSDADDRAIGCGQSVQ